MTPRPGPGGEASPPIHRLRTGSSPRSGRAVDCLSALSTDEDPACSRIPGAPPTSVWFPLRFNQESGVRFAAGCWVQCCPSQSSGHPWTCLPTAFFGCCPTDCTCPLQPVQPLLRRGLRPGNFPAALVPRLFPPGIFLPLPWRVDRPPSGTAPQAPPAAKKQRGKEGAGRVTPPSHPRPQQRINKP